MWTTVEGYFGRVFMISGGVLLTLVQSLADIRFTKPDLRRLVKAMMSIGVQTLPLAAMIGLFTGMIFALNIGLPMQDFGAETRLGSVLGIAMVRTLGPVFTAFILAARVGAAMTAELGTMAVSEEVDTLRMLGIRPTRYLAMPRVVASILMNPLLTVYACAMGLIGGMFLSESYFHVASNVYWDRVLGSMDFKEITHGLIKAVVFGATYSAICVYQGLTTTGGAEGVGRSTTRAVVASLSMILILDFLLTRAMFG